MPPHFLCLFFLAVFFPAAAISGHFPAKFVSSNSSALLFPERASRLTLRCPHLQQGTADPHQFRWFRNGQPLDRHSATLSIPSLAPDDSGFYRCFASNPWGGAFSAGTNVSVRYLDGFAADESADFFHLKFTPNRENFWLKAPRLRSGGHLMGAGLQWTWFKQSQQLLSDGIRHFVTADGDLLVLEPDETAAGTYSVQVSDGKATFSSRPFSVQTDVPPSRGAAGAPPAFAIVHRPVDSWLFPAATEEEGSNNDEKQPPMAAVQFECVPNLASKAEVEIRWHLNDLELQPVAGAVRMELEGRRLVLTRLALGHTTKTAVVRCEVRARTPDGGQSLDQADARLDILELPRINRQLLGDQLALHESDALGLSCRADRGWPRPRPSWYFNDQKIEGANSEWLNISRLSADQFGVYQCEMGNQAGVDISPVWVHRKEDRAVAAVPSGLVTAAMEEAETTTTLLPAADLIEEGPGNQSLLIGSNVQMPCRLRAHDGAAALRIVWYRNGEQIPSEGDLFRRISIQQQDGTHSQLDIHQVGPDNIGQYSCVLFSSAQGQQQQQLASRTGWLSIKEKPGMVADVHAEVVNGTGGHQQRIRVRWTPGFDGNSPVVKWSVETRTLGPSGFWSDWEHSVDQFPEQHSPVAVMGWQQASSSNSPCCAAFVENVRPSATAEFRVLAHNRFGPGKPSLASKPVTMPQQPPAAAPIKVHASARSAQSLMVQWQPPPVADQHETAAASANADDGIRGYVVRYRLSGYSTADWNERNISDGQARNALIEPLITWREYDVQVAAYNTRGLGVFSRPVAVSTLEGTPMQAPQNVRVQVLNSTAIRISFDPPNPQMVPGVNLGYKLQLWKGSPAGFGQPVRTERLPPALGRLEREIGGLAKFGAYNLTVLCFTAPGDGPASEALEFRTAEDLPGPVHGLEAVEVFSESALLQWEAPAEPNGQIQKYSLSWWEQTEPPGKRRQVDISGHSHNYSVEGLRPQTRYQLQLHAATGVGPGPGVETSFQSGLPPELPGRPSGLSVTEVGARKARLHFTPGSDGHAQIRRWLVEARQGSGAALFTPLLEVSSPPRAATSLQLDSLRPHTEYQLRLIAENVRGRSLPSEPSPSFRTQQAVPEHAPHRLWADPVSAGQISLVWLPLLHWEWNGPEPRAYVLQYRGISLATLGKMTSRKKSGKEEEEKAFQHIHWELHIAGPKQHQQLLSGLRPFSLYQLRILAQNALGRSAPGQPVLVATYEAVPSSAPPAIHAELLSGDAGIEVRWEELEAEQANGQIIAYRVTLAEKGQQNDPSKTGEVQERRVSARERRSVRFGSKVLRPNTEYTVAVRAETVVGPGPGQKQQKVLRTPEDVPDAPSNASFVYKSSDELRLGWSHPAKPKGRILHYGVLYWRLGEPRPTVPFAEMPANLHKFSATHLRHNSTYIFALKAQSAVGWGPERLFRVGTSRHSAPLPVPPVPTRDTSKAQSATELELLLGQTAETRNMNVEEEEHAHAQPRCVQLQWQIAGGEWRTEEDDDELIPAERSSHLLRGLRPNTAYRVRTRFMGDLGHSSVWSAASDWLRTMESHPTRPPSDVQLELLDGGGLKVRWQPLAKDAWNADQLGYRVQYREYEPTDTPADDDNESSFAVEEVAPSDSQPNGAMEAYLKGLKNFRHYLVQVRAFNMLGESEPSRPPRFIYIGHTKPGQRVRNLRVEALSSTSIRVQWDPLDGGPTENGQDLAHVAVNGYRIRWRPANGGAAVVETADDEMTLTERGEHTLTELRKWTSYSISVSGYNRAGEGPLATVHGRTLEDLPGPVGPLRFRHVLLGSAKVLWTPPSETNGNLTGYVLLYRTSRHRDMAEQGQQGPLLGLAESFPKKVVVAYQSDDVTCVITQEVQLRTVNTEISLDQLEENVTYFVSVRAETAAGLGPERSGEVSAGFAIGAPEAPSRPELIPEQRHVLIRWRNGPPGNSGPIIGHLIQAKRIGTAFNLQQQQMMDEKRSLSPSAHADQQKRRLRSAAGDTAPKKARHLIGHWSSIGQLNAGPAGEWRLSYRQLEPNSFYVSLFRVFATNELGIGRPSADSEQLHVPASIPEEPFYAEWWFLAIVAALLAAVVLGFVALLFFTGRVAKDSQPARAPRRKKANRVERVGEQAFDTLQLSDGGIVSYELCAKRSERGDDLLFSRPNTKQSWVGSLSGGGGPGNSPAMASRGRVGIYGSIDEEEAAFHNKGPVPRMYSALATDSIPMLNSNSEFASHGRVDTGLRAAKVQQGSGTGGSPPYYQLRQFNASACLQPYDIGGMDNNHHHFFGGGGPGTDESDSQGGGGHHQPQMGHLEEGGSDLLAAYYQQLQPERRATWRRTREQAQQEQRQRQVGGGIQLSADGRARTPVAMFGPSAEDGGDLYERRSRASENPTLSIEEETAIDGPFHGQQRSSNNDQQIAGLSSFV